MLDLAVVLRHARAWSSVIARARRQFDASVARRNWWRTDLERLQDALQELYLHAVGDRIFLNLPHLEPEFGLDHLLNEDVTLNSHLDIIHPIEGGYMVMGTVERPHPAILRYVSVLHCSCR
jgi:hypothetical protein